MEQYIDKSALTAEIERRRNYYENIQMIKPVYESNIEDFNELLSFLNTLEVKEVDLEKEIDFAMPSRYCWSGDGKAVYSKEQMRIFAKHFFELGLRSTITEEDCKLVWNIGDKIPYMPEEEFFKELLKRYKAQKGEKV